MKIKFPKRVIKKRRKKPVSCNICLIVHGTMLLYAKHQNIIAQTDDTAAELAKAARRLLPVSTKRQRIALALPSAEFVATTLELPSAAMQELEKVVKLQLPTQLPGVTEALLLAVQPPTDGKQTYALWISAKRAEELFQAFNKVGLFLTCILPRPLAVIQNNKSSYQVYDEDDSTITCLEWSKNVIQSWLHTSKLDCEVPEFKKQLDDSLSSFSTDIERKSLPTDWKNLSTPSSTAYNYAFIPPSAKARLVQAEQQKKRYGAIALIGILIISFIMGGQEALQYEQELKQDLVDLKSRTINISKLRMEAGEIEERIGALQSFPKQPVLRILEILDKIIPKDTWLTHFHIENGVVKVEGNSSDPTTLIEIFSKQPDISNVEQSGTFSGKRFSISFKLKDFDQNYWEEYFSENQ